MVEVSEGSLLGGRLIYRQFCAGHRSGFEPVLLAAAVPARVGETVLEAGTGAGAALLCLGARVGGLRGVGLERDSGLAALAEQNFRANGFSGFRAVVGDAIFLPFPAGIFDHVLCNPPWYEAAGSASPNARRALAHMAGPDLLAGWISALAPLLKPKGCLSLILPAARLAEAAACLSGFGGFSLFPLWPRAGREAKMILLRAQKGSKKPGRVLPGLVLHDGGGITPAAETVLRGGAALDF